MSIVKSLQKLYNRIEEVFIVAMLAVSVLVIFYQVVMRYCFNASPAWTEELARFLFVWMSWLGVSLTQKKGEHICIELVTGKMKGKTLAITLIVAYVVTIAICAVLVRYGYVVMELVLRTKQTSSALKFPMWIVFAACPFSCALMIMRLLAQIKKQVLVLLGKTSEDTKESEEN